jgi:hypothetical protein
MKRLSKNKSIEEEGRVMGGRSLENGVNSEGGEIGDSNYEEEKPGVCAGKSSDRNSNTDSEPLPVNSQFISNPHILLFNHISDSTPKIISCSEGSIRNNQTFTDLDQKTHKIKDLRKLSSSAKDETLFPICSGKQPRIHSTLYQALIPSIQTSLPSSNNTFYNQKSLFLFLSHFYLHLFFLFFQKYSISFGLQTKSIFPRAI